MSGSGSASGLTMHEICQIVGYMKEIHDGLQRDIGVLSLKFSAEGKSLRILAFGELAAKVIYSATDALSEGEVKKRIASVLGIKNVSMEQVRSGLAYLAETRRAEADKRGRWRLKAATTEEIARARNESERIRGAVLDRHFPGRIDKNILEDWFLEASAAVLGHFGDEWVTSASKGTVSIRLSRPRSLEQLLRSVIGKHKLEASSNELIAGYRGFRA